MTQHVAHITASAQVTGLHHWPEAPERRAYLRNPHRHIFKAEAELSVTHGDREVEFHDLGEHVEVLLHGLGEQYHAESTLVDFGARSCEHLARTLFDRLTDEGMTVVRVTVSEDGEHAGVILA